MSVDITPELIPCVGIILVICGVLGLVITLLLVRGGRRGDGTVARDREPY
jgi:hypothetical protein